MGYRPRGHRELDATEHARMPVCSDAGTGDRDAKDGVGYKLIQKEKKKIFLMGDN